MEELVAHPEFWRGKRVLVTGHTGFKGGWLSLWLSALGAEVTGYALPPAAGPSFFEAASLPSRMRSVTEDVRDLPRLEAAFASAAPEVVFHLAAQSLVRRSYEDTVETYSTNVMGTVHLLEAVRRSPSTRAVVVVTSDKCYENREWPWGYRETDPMGGYDPYSSSKGCAELVTAAFRRSFFSSPGPERPPGIASARAGNVIGGGDWARDRIVPDFVRAAEAGKPLFVRNPNAVRPWQHVLEPLAGYLTLAERLFQAPDRFSEAWNFGPADADAVPVSLVVDRLTSAWGEGAAWEMDRNPHPHEANFLKLDCSKARNSLGFRPRLGLPEALLWVTTWYKQFLSGKSMLDLSLQQIRAYEALRPV